MDTRTDRFRALFDECFQPLHAYTRRRAHPADVDDVVAEVLATAWRRLDEIPVGRELPWVYGVARRALANHRRGITRRRWLQARLDAEPRALLTSAGHDDVVSAALARLTSRDQEVLRLHAWEDLPVADIAVALGCSENAAALRLSRARKKFREEMTALDATRTHAERKVTDV
ncbi:MAG: sigma-70 family RNA polymerase sigma factor [Acidimicrobiales bacterium]|nr:sigma-70 family RNA polymerase sigma factor [Acidimicrobiales bacterium]